MDKIAELEERLSQTRGLNVGLLAIVITLYAGYVKAMGGDQNAAVQLIKKTLDDNVSSLSCLDEERDVDTTDMVRTQLSQLIEQAEAAVREVLAVDAPPHSDTRH